MQKIYILGASGFIGSKLAHYVSKKTEFSVKTAGRVGADISVDIGSPCDEFLKLLAEGDVVIFLSSISSPDICSRDPIYAEKINVFSTINLITKMANAGVRVIFTSTDVVYGCNKGISLDDTKLAPFGEYGKMKAKVESVITKLRHVKVVRFSYVLGEDDKYTAFLEGWSLNHGEYLGVYKGFKRNIVCIDDVLLGITNLVLKWDQYSACQINFSGGQLVGRDELTVMFAEYVCNNLKYNVVEAPDSFWEARPKVIKTQSHIFEGLLGRPIMSVGDKIKKWRK